MGQQAAGSTRESVSRQLGQALRGRADCPPERRSCLAVGPSLLAMINALLAGFVRCQGAGAELGREGGVHQGSEATAGGCVAGTLGAPSTPGVWLGWRGGAQREQGVLIERKTPTTAALCVQESQDHPGSPSNSHSVRVAQIRYPWGWPRDSAFLKIPRCSCCCCSTAHMLGEQD